MSAPDSRRRLRLAITGAVQGVGFRPHVYRLARRLGVPGWISNDSDGVHIEVEGPREVVLRFEEELTRTPPPQARLAEVTRSWLDPVGYTDFEIRTSREGGPPSATILPDLATCPECLEDVHTRGNRRAGYPFTNCTECGPRFTIVRRLPYDRPNTTMVGFRQCPECLSEYTSPEDRRFHAQPNACPRCGPRLVWEPGPAGPMSASAGEGRDEDEVALQACVEALRVGRVVAVQGLGGFHLMVDAGSEEAVARLRVRKGREAKPFALMVADRPMAEEIVEMNEDARSLFGSAAAPIVLLPRRGEGAVADGVAPGQRRLGVMRAYTPLHHLLMESFGAPLVATSGNRSQEPICIAPGEARRRLAGIADDFLVHDRPIERPVDDSLTTIGPAGPMVLRRARGFAPLPVPMPTHGRSILSVGGHLKNTITVARDDQAWVSQHIGDLDTPEAREAFRATLEDFTRLYRVRPDVIAHDLHPDYASTRWAREEVGDDAEGDVRLVAVQHHHAHLAALLVEHDPSPSGPTGRGWGGPVLGVVWDGTGDGGDGTVWGGEFLLGGIDAVRRVGHLRSFRLPGGEAAVREPRRAALGLLTAAELMGHPGARLVAEAFRTDERELLEQLLDQGVRAPWTSSAGRFFDAVASILGLRHRSRFEGDAAMALETVAAPEEDGGYPVTLQRAGEGPWVLDWSPMLEALLDDLAGGAPAPVSAARVHNGLVEGIRRLSGALDVETVGLTGGCFQNARLTFGAWSALREAGHRVLLHRAIPPGDGGISLGQAAVAGATASRDGL